MRKLTLLLVLVSSALLADQSINVSGVTYGVTVANQAPYNTPSTFSNQLTFRLHDWTLPGSGTVQVMRWSLWYVYFNTTSICVEDDSYYGSFSEDGQDCIRIDGISSKDILVSLTHYATPTVGYGWWAISVTDAQNPTVRYYQQCGSQTGNTTNQDLICHSASTPNGISWAGSSTAFGTNQIGPANTKIAHIHWSSSLIGVRAGGWYYDLGKLGEYTDSQADLGSWRLEGNSTNTNGSTGTTLADTSGGTWVTSPTRNPVCVGGVGQTVRTVTGSIHVEFDRSFSFNSTLTHSISNTAGGLTGSSSVANGSWTGSMSFGPLTFSDTVTDGNSATATCSEYDGAVVADTNGIVTFPDSRIGRILSSVVKYGRPDAPDADGRLGNPWNWQDDRDRNQADHDWELMHSSYSVNGSDQPFWNINSTGTVSINNASRPDQTKTLTGVGTAFTSQCAYDASGTAIILWYNGGHNRWFDVVASVTNDTTLVLQQGVFRNIPDEANIQFTCVPGASSIWQQWYFSASTANYYDTVASLYQLYYRSGIATYSGYARKKADWMWTIPWIDRGNAWDQYLGNGNAYAWALPRKVWSEWPYLYAIDCEIAGGCSYNPWTDGMAKFDAFYASWGPNNTWDIREKAVGFQGIALCAAFDTTNTTAQGNCKTTLVNYFPSEITAHRYQTQLGNYFFGCLLPECVDSTQHATYAGSAGTVTVTNGSSTVTLNSGSFSSSWFTGSGTTNNIWITATGSKPTSPSDGDPIMYLATYVDATHLTLSNVNGGAQTYQGTSGSTKGFIIGGDCHAGLGCGTQNTGVVGFGTQPMFEGLYGRTMYYVDFAMHDVASGGVCTSSCNNTLGNTANGYLQEVLPFEMNEAVRPATNGFLYFAGANCYPTVSETNNTSCLGGSDYSSSIPANSRDLVGEALFGMTMSLKARGNSSSDRSWLAQYYAYIWSKAVSTFPVAGDGVYITNLDSYALSAAYWNMYANSNGVQVEKFYGLYQGQGQSSAFIGQYLSTNGGSSSGGNSSIGGNATIH